MQEVHEDTMIPIVGGKRGLLVCALEVPRLSGSRCREAERHAVAPSHHHHDDHQSTARTVRLGAFTTTVMSKKSGQLATKAAGRQLAGGGFVDHWSLALAPRLIPIA